MLRRVDARLLNIDRIVAYGKKDVLQLIDRNTHEVLANVKQWNWKRLNPLDKSAPNHRIDLVSNSAIEELLPVCAVALNGYVHDVVVRDRPISVSDKIWTFRTLATSEKLEE
jgi:hypothetical protein